MAKFDQRDQKIDGDQINVGKDLNIFNPIFLSDTVVAQLWFSIAIQWTTYIIAIIGFAVLRAGFSLYCIFFSCIYTLILIPHSLFCFFIGVQNKNRKVIGLSIVAGVSPVLYWILYYLSIAISVGILSIIQGVP